MFTRRIVHLVHNKQISYWSAVVVNRAETFAFPRDNKTHTSTTTNKHHPSVGRMNQTFGVGCYSSAPCPRPSGSASVSSLLRSRRSLSSPPAASMPSSCPGKPWKSSFSWVKILFGFFFFSLFVSQSPPRPCLQDQRKFDCIAVDARSVSLTCANLKKMNFQKLVLIANNFSLDTFSQEVFIPPESCQGYGDLSGGFLSDHSCPLFSCAPKVVIIIYIYNTPHIIL